MTECEAERDAYLGMLSDLMLIPADRIRVATQKWLRTPDAEELRLADTQTGKAE